MKSVNTVINARWVVPVDATNSVLDHYSIAIADNRIHSILPSVDAASLFPTAKRVNLPTHAITPGFINAHTHAAMTLFRGVAEDFELETWLQQYIWPLEGKWVSPEFVRDGTKIAIAEMIKSGTTCMNDMYFFPEVIGEVAQQTGMRASLGMIVLEFPTAWAKSATEYLDKGLDLYSQFENDPLVSTVLAPHAPYTVADNTFENILSLSDERNLPIHMHVHETDNEIENSLKEHGVRPIERLKQLGLVNPKLIAVHATQLLTQEIELFAKAKTSVAHCPKSNLKLASGFCPIAELLRNNVNVALGTDGAASNNNLNMIGEMRFAALLAKGRTLDATAVSVHETLRMATINGAKCLGLESQTGSLEPGKLADITAINLESISSVPIYNPVAQIVHAASSRQVSDVWINGTQVLRDSVLTTIDEAELISVAHQYGQEISNSAQ